MSEQARIWLWVIAIVAAIGLITYVPGYPIL